MKFRHSLMMITCLLAVMLFATVGNAATLSSPPSGNSVCCYGNPDTLTYGQVFTAPVTGVLTSFTLYLDGGVGGDLWGGVGTWDGNGSPSNLYQSANVSSGAGGAFTFSPNIAVIAGNDYVAYLSVFGTNATTTTSMPLGLGGANIGSFVWNNGSDPRNNADWNYFFDPGPAQFNAEFRESVSAVPEPASLGMLVMGLAGFASAAYRKTRA